MTESTRPTGPEVIRDFVSRLPSKSGVYRMYDAKGDVIYVGKARNLKNRVSNYTRPTGHTNRIAAMILLTAHMEFVTTNSEAEA
ncbi:MAG: GIY-YIG nuclease family protein, partial [Alphaproteobacteria bacterium]|nr:GIY-YIG nuclease family protein [Alphaproteobacteria bacterium]